MLFNSIDFAIFLPIVFFLYWFVSKQNIKLQNLLIVGASLVFYGWWDWRFLSLLVLSASIDFFVGLGINSSKNQGIRKALLLTSLASNLGLLFFFKYCDFFITGFIAAFRILGMPLQERLFHFILPVGISFYTFQTLSYSIDIYRRKLCPTKNYISFLAYVGFFPQLVAGPIERAINLLPQFEKQRIFDYSKAVDGLRQILWGFFKKIIIADKCAEFSNIIFDGYMDYSGSTLLLGALFFAFQIYGDFSGYSDIAIGVSKLFGFTLMKNFSFPYFSRDIAEFWRRWHISLSSWFRDYVYIPLGGSRKGLLYSIRNIFIIFILSGFWHGANLTFILWGLINAVYFLPLFIIDKNRENLVTVAKGKLFPSISEALSISVTFVLTCLAWVSFRSQSLSQAIIIYRKIFSKTLITIPIFPWRGRAFATLLLVIIFTTIEWLGRDNEFAIEKTWLRTNRILRWAIYSLICTYIFINMGSEQQFIYFQF